MSELTYRLSGQELIVHEANAMAALPKLLAQFGYERVFVVCSRSINTKTNTVERLRSCLGEKLVGLTDEVGEHSPLSNVLRAARQARDCQADVLVSLGGGSVMDMCKAIQLCISEDVYDRSELLKLQFVTTEGGEIVSGSKKAPRIRQIAIPTTLATAEWTSASTPIDDETHLKARFLVPQGSPRGIIYDPGILAQTPSHLLLSTGVRGLDHAINTACSASPHPLAGMLAEKAIRLYMENLPLVQNEPSSAALTNCQLATWYTGMGQMSVPHGFSHWMVHIVGPYGGVPHSKAACVLMLAQAKWLEGWAEPEHGRLSAALGQPDVPFHRILREFLVRLNMPLTFADLGLTRQKVEDMIGPALEHPMVTRNNRRPIRTETELRAILALAGNSD